PPPSAALHKCRCAPPETLPPQGWEVLGGAPAFPGSHAGGQALGFTSTRLLSRRAPAQGIPMLWGRTCPAFARWMVASPAAQPSRLRTLPEILGKRGKEGLQIEMRRQKCRVQVALHRPNPAGARMPALGEWFLAIGATAMTIVREPGT